MTVAELLAGISSRELSEWAEYDKLEPFGQGRADLRAGIVASTVANVNRAPDQKLYTPEDFIGGAARVGPEPSYTEDDDDPEADEYDEPEPEPTDDAESWQAQLALIEQLNTAYGGADLRE